MLEVFLFGRQPQVNQVAVGKNDLDLAARVDMQELHLCAVARRHLASSHRLRSPVYAVCAQIASNS